MSPPSPRRPLPPRQALSPRLPLRLGAITVDPPVVLAPMAGVTNAPFRRLCRREAMAAAGEDRAPIGVTRGLFVSEMVMARAVVESNGRTDRMLAFGPGERPRSVQLYCTDARYADLATRRLVDELGVEHIDLNFGCPAAKVTRIGGGAALPVKPRLLAAVVGAVVSAAGEIPVTMKFRKGVDDSLLTFVEAGRIGALEGCAAVALHARTAEQHYSGSADWDSIAELKAALGGFPVLGNGDIWEAGDAVAMMAATGCDGVVVGRGCLGRPWLFGDLVRVMSGSDAGAAPLLGRVGVIMREHAVALEELFGGSRGVREFRKHTAWYLTGYPVGPEVRRALGLIGTIGDLDRLLGELDATLAPVPGAGRIRRGHTSGPRPVRLPDGFLDENWRPSGDEPLEMAVSGG